MEAPTASCSSARCRHCSRSRPTVGCCISAILTARLRPASPSRVVRMETLPACATTSARTSRGRCSHWLRKRRRSPVSRPRPCIVRHMRSSSLSERPVARQTLGVSYVAPDHFASDEVAPEQMVPDRDRTMIRSGTEEGARRSPAWTPKGCRPSSSNWAIRPSGRRGVSRAPADEIVAVTETVRRGARGVEAGVMTLPEQRRRGYASAATASWITHPELDRFTCFYSTEITNRASQSVARRLGLRFIGSTLQLD